MCVTTLVKKTNTVFYNESYIPVTILQHDSMEKIIALELEASVRASAV